jgi:hypothetical protein
VGYNGLLTAVVFAKERLEAVVALVGGRHTQPGPRMSDMAIGTSAPARKRKNIKRRTKYQLPTRDNLDGRTNAAKAFDRLFSAMTLAAI